MISRVLLYSGLATLLFSCNNADDKVTPKETFVSNFYGTADQLDIQVGFEEGAQPYTTFNTQNAWEITQDNITSLLSSKEIEVTTPISLADMQNLGILDQINYTRQNIIDLSVSLQQYNNEGSIQGITILFLDGLFIKDGQPNNRVLGINLNETSTLAIFKPVVESAGNGSAARTLVEQTTVVHEIGHALGLVNNGVAATSAHHDEENGAHCTNEDCVMYWQNGGGEISEFIRPFILGGEIELFKSQCIDDIKAK